jgi:hypothetical protein
VKRNIPYIGPVEEIELSNYLDELPDMEFWVERLDDGHLKATFLGFVPRLDPDQETKQ